MATEQDAYFYFITATCAGQSPIELSGTVIPAPGATRLRVFDELRETIRGKFAGDPAPNRVQITAFALEPNVIGS